MKSVWTLFLVAIAASMAACGGDEEEGGTKQAGEACDTDSECANGSCVASADGSKACAQSDDSDDGGW